jgi:hypothetical protein
MSRFIVMLCAFFGALLILGVGFPSTLQTAITVGSWPFSWATLGAIGVAVLSWRL